MQKLTENIQMIRTDERTCSNIYLLDNGKGEKLIIDSGDGGVQELDSLTPTYTFLTHSHHDHSGGVKPDWQNVYLHERDFVKLLFRIVPKNARAYDFKNFKWGTFNLEIYWTPGHTEGSICILEKNNGLLFSGDTKFADGDRGRTDLPGGNEEKIIDSLKFIDKLDYKLLCPGHGPTEQK
ncbi:Hydroxyacylglutathione hydrolase [Candidatus Gugararchaeum adminiculabundum]|nr:Hydroxyacylglutathione hydrolase [Candidatus Gugararchaeum adminiculabundum]